MPARLLTCRARRSAVAPRPSTAAARDQVAVARVRLEAAVDDEARVGQPLGLVLDPERLDLLTDEVVREPLLRVREAGPGLAVDEELAVGAARLQKRAGGVADDNGHR